MRSDHVIGTGWEQLDLLAIPRVVVDQRLESTLAPAMGWLVKKFDCIAAMKALGEENRLRMVRRLLKGRCSVNELAEALEISQYNVSKHLRVLREAGLLELEKQGQQRLYSLAAAFAEHLKKNSSVLDLGCCQFDFAKLPR